ncbi:hypothetical protein [Bradyrhizobium sp. Arg816]|uniref:hypothetical protein n=1 Tax=Bradyrhizobium sp. Arg816 TaxID=2998491 RepID=UPI00249F2128|nr:hypothetical protein [Bradyrhizobium sp. Arg816]MDI3562370.1 hypothetical protein [Bradyrhizobium sp. Arg816]
MRMQIGRQHAGISTASAETLLQRMQVKVEGLCTERDRLVQEECPEGRSYISGMPIKGTPAHRGM